MTNRILLHLGKNCPHCKAEKIIDEFRQVAEAIEESATKAILCFWMPGLAAFVDDGDRETKFLLNVSAVKTTIDDDLFAYTTSELRRIAGELTAAADRVDLLQSGQEVL